MNWYKKAQQRIYPIMIAFYNHSTGDLGVSYNGGKTYVYPNISPYQKEYLEKLLGVKNYSTVSKFLKGITPKGNNVEQHDKNETMEELHNRGILK